MKCAILCGGKGMRMGELSYLKPKPLAEVHGKPLLLHIMNLYKKHNIKDFVLLLGYKGEVIKEYFIDYSWKKNSFTLNTKNQAIENTESGLDFNITFLDTGENSQTGSRIYQAKKYLDGETFLLTYGDGISNVDISSLIDHHKKIGKVATVTGIRKKNQYGILEVQDELATSFEEKGYSNEIINGGFFCFEPTVFNYIKNKEDCILEEEPLKELASNKQLSVYQHNGFWKSVDTQKDLSDINQLPKSLWEE